MKLGNEGLDLNKKVTRRGFLGATLLAGATLLPDAVKNLPDILDSQNKDENEFNKFVKEVEELAPEDTEYLSKLEYPKIAEVPELLQNYAKQFSSWVEVAKDQKKKVAQFTCSAHAQKIFFSQYKEMFPKNSQEKNNKLTKDLIIARLKNLALNRTTFNRIHDEGVFGSYTIKENESTLDTIKFEPRMVADLRTPNEKHSNYKTEFFISTHEYFHATQLPAGITRGSFLKTIEILNEVNRITNYNMEFEKSLMKSDSITGRVTSIEKGTSLKYFERVPEFQAFLMQIRATLHEVSATNKNLIKFDMFNDNFTEEHFKFLEKNEEKIFFTYYAVDTSNQMVFTRFYRELKKRLTTEDFVYLMNFAI